VKLSTKEIIHMARLMLDYEMGRRGREFDLGFQHAIIIIIITVLRAFIKDDDQKRCKSN
jgi:hypothetical protein